MKVLHYRAPGGLVPVRAVRRATRTVGLRGHESHRLHPWTPVDTCLFTAVVVMEARHGLRLGEELFALNEQLVLAESEVQWRPLPTLRQDVPD